MKKIILDCDGVLLDYNLAYAKLWKRAYGVDPKVRDPDGYSVMDQYMIPKLTGEAWNHFRFFYRSEEFWNSMPAIEGAVNACVEMTKLGYELIVVSACDEKHRAPRLKNLLDHGFPISGLYTTGSDFVGGKSPKAQVINNLDASYFLDDFADYFSGIVGVTRVLVDRKPKNSPNRLSQETYDMSVNHIESFASWLSIQHR